MGFLNKLAIMQTNDNQLFLEEFGSIDMNPQYSTDVANLPLNRAKNRYNNILPYDHNRVKLSSHKHSTDYINANFCSVSGVKVRMLWVGWWVWNVTNMILKRNIYSNSLVTN